MLSQLLIRNFAIINQTELELQAGMTALTGETGAGKSILLDALGLVLGDRADTHSIRDGTHKAEITADFQPHNSSPVWQWLQDHDLDQDGACILRRIVSKDNRSRGYINGSPVSLLMLKAVGEMLVNIHGQHEHQSLTNPQYQREILDNHAGNTALLNELNGAYKAWNYANKQYEKIQSEYDQRLQRIDMLQFQIQEFDSLELDEEELLTIENEHKRAANSEQLFDFSNESYFLLFEGDDSAYSLLNRVELKLQDLKQLDDRASEYLELVNSAAIQCSEAATGLKHYTESINVDPQRLQWFDQRLSSLHNMAKKHRVPLHELCNAERIIKCELEELQSSDLILENLKKQIFEKKSNYKKFADQLSQKRKIAAKTMSRSISQAMQQLAMNGGVFEINIIEQQSPQPNIHGQDDVQFLVSTNPGQNLRALGKVASGGELSRISLAIQLIASKHQSVETLIFDEVDSGVGGGVAETVGQYLRKLTSKCQILCVTHLPQVAAQAHHHYRVMKSTDGKQTNTQLAALDQKETIEEIARMLGGKHISKQTRDHAEQMLISGKSTR